MALYKNQASQKVVVYAYDTAAEAPKTGDAANITGYISLDGGTPAATNDTNPTEIHATNHKGLYAFDLTQAESNADIFSLFAESATADVVIEPVIIYTLPGSNAAVKSTLIATGLDAILYTATGAIALAQAVWRYAIGGLLGVSGSAAEYWSWVYGMARAAAGATVIGDALGAKITTGSTAQFPAFSSDGSITVDNYYLLLGNRTEPVPAFEETLFTITDGTLTAFTPAGESWADYIVVTIAGGTGGQVAGDLTLNVVSGDGASYTLVYSLPAVAAGETQKFVLRKDGSLGSSELFNVSYPALTMAAAASFTPQEIRDSMKLAPTAGAPAADSVDAHLDSLITGQGTLQTEHAALDAGHSSISSEISALSIPSADEIWLHEIEADGNYTAAEIMRAVFARAAGNREGGGTTTLKWYRPDGITEAIKFDSVDVDGNTATITLNLDPPGA